MVSALLVLFFQGVQDSGPLGVQQPEKAGWIRKFCGRGIFRELWRSRYVVLKGDHLFISDKEVRTETRWTNQTLIPGFWSRQREFFLLFLGSDCGEVHSFSSCSVSGTSLGVSVSRRQLVSSSCERHEEEKQIRVSDLWSKSLLCERLRFYNDQRLECAGATCCSHSASKHRNILDQMKNHDTWGASQVLALLKIKRSTNKPQTNKKRLTITTERFKRI